MKITKKLIKSLNPCKGRYKNYLKYYGDKALTIRQFMGRKNITHADKLWVAFRLMPRDKVRLAAADIAESVLHIFEARYPNDDRPRKAIAAARAGDVDKAREAASVTSGTAYFVAASAYFAATISAYAEADDYAISAVYVSVNSVSAAAYARPRRCSIYNQEKLIRKIILKYWK